MKRRNKRCPIFSDCGEDRLSQLPNVVICHILSFLSTKEAVTTSVLSTRYRSLYASVPAIDLDFFEFWDFKKLNLKYIEKREQHFVGIVDKMLKVADAVNLNKFRLLFDGYYNKPPFSSWTLNVLQRGVQTFDVRFRASDECGFLPTELFSCTTITVLKLNTSVPITVPEIVDLPNLKVLHLQGRILASSNHFLGKAFGGCRFLEELQISYYVSTGVQTLDISIPSLKKLILLKGGGDGMDKIVVNTPNLLLLEVRGSLDKEIVIENLSPLVRAYICLQYKEESQEVGLSLCQNLALFIGGMSSVKFLSLSLSQKTLKLLSLANYSWLTWHKLTHLEIEADPAIHYELLPVILDAVPKLESLVIEMVPEDGCPDYGNAEQFEVPVLQKEPARLSKHLQEVKIRHFFGRESDIHLAQYILLYGEVLKRITIFHFEDKFSSNSPLAVCKKLLLLTRSSKNCQLCFL